VGFLITPPQKKGRNERGKGNFEGLDLEDIDHLLAWEASFRREVDEMSIMAIAYPFWIIWMERNKSFQLVYFLSAMIISESRLHIFGQGEPLFLLDLIKFVDNCLTTTIPSRSCRSRIRELIAVSVVVISFYLDGACFCCFAFIPFRLTG